MYDLEDQYVQDKYELLSNPFNPDPARPRRGARRSRGVAAALALGLATAVQAGGFLDERAVAAAATPLVPAHWIQAAATADADPPTVRRCSSTRSTGCRPGEPQSLCQYQGKVLLIVNTASYCGYTQAVRGAGGACTASTRTAASSSSGFPSNDFSQEPGNNKEIAEFCRTTYGVQFPLFEKTTVAQLAPIRCTCELAKATGQAPQWNFHKYVVDRNGKPVASFASAVVPDAREITSLIEKLLEQKPAAGPRLTASVRGDAAAHAAAAPVARHAAAASPASPHAPNPRAASVARIVNEGPP